MSRSVLVLSDGTCFEGRAFGAKNVECVGEVVFSTAMTGYTELLSDPSFKEQILTLTYPEVGNTGVCLRDMESGKIQASGLIVRQLSPVVSNWRSQIALSDWLEQAGIPGIEGIDTRALVRHLRDRGAMMGILSTKDDADIEELKKRAANLGTMAGRELVSQVTTDKTYSWSEGLSDLAGNPLPHPKAEFHVVVIDFGVKRNTLRLLVQHGCRVTVVPAHSTAKEVFSLKPDGVLLSNGPGDPEVVETGIQTVKDLLGKVPLFGICMGNQILGLALGAKTYKLKFGHRGANQPVNVDSKVLITSQNHGFAVDEKTLPKHDGLQLNLSDGTVEGFEIPDQFAFSVQYHPEGGPGPHDAAHFFGRFVELMKRFKARG